MGRHSERKAGYLPKVAAGVAPFALVMAAPAGAWATPELPVEHQHTGSLDRGIEQGISERSGLSSSFLTGFMTATSDDRIASGAAEVRTGGNGRVDTAIGRRDTWSSGQVRSQGGSRFGTATSRTDTVHLGDGVDALSQSSESSSLSLDRTDLFRGDGLLSDLSGSAALGRASYRSLELGQLGALGTRSEQQASGTFSGLLDLAGESGTATGATSGAVSQAHAIGGRLGPVTASTASSQSGKVGYLGAFRGTLSEGGEAGVSNSFSGDLGLDHVLTLNTDVKTEGSASGAIHQPVPGIPVTKQTSSVDQELGGRITVLDQPAGGGLKITAPPLDIQPAQ